MAKTQPIGILLHSATTFDSLCISGRSFVESYGGKDFTKYVYEVVPVPFVLLQNPHDTSLPEELSSIVSGASCPKSFAAARTALRTYVDGRNDLPGDNGFKKPIKLDLVVEKRNDDGLSAAYVGVFTSRNEFHNTGVDMAPALMEIGEGILNQCVCDMGNIIMHVQSLGIKLRDVEINLSKWIELLTFFGDGNESTPISDALNQIGDDMVKYKQGESVQELIMSSFGAVSAYCDFELTGATMLALVGNNIVKGTTLKNLAGRIQDEEKKCCLSRISRILVTSGGVEHRMIDKDNASVKLRVRHERVGSKVHTSVTDFAF